jgi:hypothetical protein
LEESKCLLYSLGKAHNQYLYGIRVSNPSYLPSNRKKEKERKNTKSVIILVPKNTTGSN